MTPRRAAIARHSARLARTAAAVPVTAPKTPTVVTLTHVRGETYPCEPYRDRTLGGGARFDYRMGYRALIGDRDLGLYPSRNAAERAIAAGKTTPDAINAGDGIGAPRGANGKPTPAA